MKRLVLPLVLTCLLAACGAGEEAGSPVAPDDMGGQPGGQMVQPDESSTVPPFQQESPAEVLEGDREPSSPNQTAGADVVPGSPLERALADLSERLGRPIGEIAVVSSEDVTWRDGSLGCPQPDMMYTQALVDGIRIVLAIDGQAYEYHGSRTGEPFYCENPQPPLGSAGGGGDA